MGRKVHPLGFRLGIIRDWQSKWYDEQHYADFILEDLKLRKAIQKKYPEASISLIEIERQANKVGVTIHTARPGIVIGRGGSRVEEMRQFLEGILGGKKVQLDVREIRQPELDSYLVARSVAEQMERRVAYRRAMKQSIFRTLQAGAKGMRITCSGRLGGVEIARRQMMHQGRVPLQTLRADIDYGFAEAHTTLGRIGVKVWIYRGDIFAEAETAKAARAAAAAEMAVPAAAPLVASVAPPPEAPAAKPAPAVVETRTEAPAKAEVAETKKPRAHKKIETAAEVLAEAKPAEEAAPAKPKRAAKPKAEAEPEAKPAKAAAKPVKSPEKPAKAEAETPAKAKKSEAKEKPAESKAEAKPSKPKAKKTE
jgi:small subunit ribosomal protein S3